MGVARSSGNRPKAPPLPASRPTARPPGERRLFFQKLRGLESTVCAPQGQVGKWSRRRRGEEERVGRGAPRFSAKYQPWEVAPRFLTLCGYKRHEAEGRGVRGQTPPEARTRCHPPSHPPITARLTPPPRKCRAAPGARRHPRGGGGNEPKKGPLSLYSSPFLPEVAHNFKFPCLGC